MTFDIQTFYDQLDRRFQTDDAQGLEQFMTQALSQAKQTADTYGIIAVENELGGLYRAAGRVQEAQALYDDVLMQLAIVGQKDSDNYATALINAGDVYVVDKQYQKALGLFLEAKNILIACYLQEDYRMAALQNNISAVYREMGEYKEAEKALQVALEIIAKMANAQSEHATTLINFAQLQMKQGKFEEAKETLLETIRLFETSLNDHDIHQGQAWAALGDVGYYQGDYDAAILAYQKAQGYIQRDFGMNEFYELMNKNIEQAKRTKEV